MKIVGEHEIRKSVNLTDAIAAMREAVVAQSRGECDTPMPMHLDLSSGGGGEVHMKSGYRKGGKHFALKIAGTYVKRPYGSIVLVSVETGDTVVYFDDGGYLTDLRTAAVSAMVAKELGRKDTILGILGTGVQARLQALLHAAGPAARRGPSSGDARPKSAAACAREIGVSLPGVRVVVVDSPAEVAARASLIVDCHGLPIAAAAGRRHPPGHPHLRRRLRLPPASRSSTPRSCAGRRSSSWTRSSSASGSASCSTQPPRRPARSRSATFCDRPTPYDRAGVTVADFTGLGAEDLFIAEACSRRLEEGA